MGGGLANVVDVPQGLKDSISCKSVPDTKKRDQASSQPLPPDEDVANDSMSTGGHRNTGDTDGHSFSNHHPSCCCCHWSNEVNAVAAAKQTTVQVTCDLDPKPKTPPDQRKRWAAVWRESLLYSRPPWQHGRQPRTPFAEWSFHQPLSRPISSDQLTAEVKGIYAGYVMVESKCIEVDNMCNSYLFQHDIDVIPFLEATPRPVLIQLQRGHVDPEEVVRNALVSSRNRITDIVNTWNKLPWGRKNSVTVCNIPVSGHRSIGIYIRRTDLDLHVPTIEESLHGFLVSQESCAKESGSPDYQRLADLTTRTIGDKERAKVATRPRILTVGHDIVKAIEGATVQAKCNIARQVEEIEKRQAQSRAQKEATSKAEEEARNNAIHSLCECCGGPLCTHETMIDDEEGEDVRAKQQITDAKLSTLPIETRPLSDQSLYKEIGQVHYRYVDGRWMNISLSNTQYQALTDIHTTGVNEMHDFFLASLHPKASAALKHLSAKYAMPARLWRHCIHSYLEVLRRRLPESAEHMMRFVLQSYSMMQLLDETTDIGPVTLECIGDLARYRFAIEDEDAIARLHWRGVSERYYEKRSAIEPSVGRIYHHFGVLSRSAYTSSFFNNLKALTVSQPFQSAWKTIVSCILPQFVAAGNQTSTTLAKRLSLDEDNLYTAITHLLLASAPSQYLQESRFDTCMKSHLHAFDTLLRLVAGLDDPKSTLNSNLLALFQTSMNAQASSTIIDLSPPLVGPASHYLRPTCYVSGKTTMGAPACHAIPREHDAIPSLTPNASAQSFLVRPSPELGLVLCQLLLLNNDSDVADRAAQLLSVVNFRILARPPTFDIRLWEYLHVLLVFMRCLNSRRDLKKRFGYAFHPELMAPLLNLLLRRVKDRGGDSWDSLFRPEFPTIWVPLNAKEKPGKYGLNTAHLQRQYFAHNPEQDTDSTNTNNVAVVPKEGDHKTATNGDDLQESVSLSAAEGAFIGLDVADSQTGLSEKQIQERLYTLVLPEDRLLRGFSFAKETPSCMKPTQPLSEKQMAYKRWEEEEAKVAQLKRNKKRQLTTKKQQTKDRKREKRIARGVERDPQRQTCAGCRMLAKRGIDHAATHEVCQGHSGYGQVGSLDPVATKTTEEFLPTILESAAKVFKEQPKDDFLKTTKTTEHGENHRKDVPADVSKAAKHPTTSVLTEITYKGARCTHSVFVGPEKLVENTSDVISPETGTGLDTPQSILKEATDVMAPDQESRNPVIDAIQVSESDSDQLSYLSLLFGEPSEVDEAINENASSPKEVKRTGDNADVGAACGEADEPAEAESESDDQRMLEETWNETEAQCLDPYFYPPDFFGRSKLDWDDLLTCRDYVQPAEMTEAREVRILWTAISGQGFFTFQPDKNGDYTIDVPENMSKLLPCFDAPMPAIIERADGSRVVYVSPTVAGIVAEQDDQWRKAAEKVDRRHGEHEQKKRVEQERKQEGESIGEKEKAQDKKSSNLRSSAPLGSSHEPCETVKNGIAYQAKEKNEVETKQEQLGATEEEVEIAEDIGLLQDPDAGGEWYGILRETPIEEAAKDTSPTTHAGVADEPSNQIVGLPEPTSAQLTRTVVAAIPVRDEWDIEFPPKRRSSRESVKEWVNTQREDGIGENGGDNDDENSDGWTELLNDMPHVDAAVGQPQKPAPKSISSRSFWADWAWRD